MLLRRTLNHANQRLQQSGQLMAKADDLVDLANAIAGDARDGGKITFILLPGFSGFFSRLVLSLSSYLVKNVVYAIRSTMSSAIEPPVLDLDWMEGQKVPVGISFDLEFDALPPSGQDITFHDGPYDGKTYKGLGEDYAPGGKFFGRTRVTMEDGSTYIWNGYVMEYDGGAD